MLFRNISAVANHRRNQKQQKPTQKNGIIIIQIDGLSHDQLGRAIQCGRLPFLNKLITKKHYRLHHLYSGLPSSTPAVQGELFYGVKCCVPAFSFMYADPVSNKKDSPDSKDKRVVTMFDSEVALVIEQELANEGDALLKEGSSYANVFSGGAKKAHFCSTSMGWNQFFRHLNPLGVLQFILFDFLLCLKMFGLALVELFLAVIDFIRGTVFQRHDFFK